ncbi:MAG: hypothetical protein JO304_09070 [Solirubrobacterales bacterium]|nr:hypothetical protein [Solirubrobacterales bacterium]
MNAQLNHMIARQRSAGLHRAGEQGRLAGEVSAGRRNLRDATLITRLGARLVHLTARSAPTRP